MAIRPHWDPEDNWEEHPRLPVSAWQQDICDDNSRLGYIDWVNMVLESAAEDEEEGTA